VLKVDDKDRGGEKPRNNFDLTTPYIPAQYDGRGQRPGEPDRTAINLPPQSPQGNDPAPRQPANKFDLTSVSVGTPYVEERVVPTARPATPRSQVQVAATRAESNRRVPAWAWALAGVGALLLLLAVGYYLLMPPSQPFTLRVVGLPPGSKLYVDDVLSGVPQKDGTITKTGLSTSDPHDVSVVCDGYADWRETVKGESGNLIERKPALVPVKASLPPEIDYNGAMVLVTAGEFEMGSDDSWENERPSHKVSLPDFYIDKYEVTNEQYAKFCQATNHAPPADPAPLPGYFQNSPRMPVMGISYFDAVAFAKWAGKRLPTEEEWEKSASWDPQARRKREWPWGDTEEANRANVHTNQPANVGQYVGGASPYGVQDMAGNAAEWVDSTYNPYPGNSAGDKDFNKNLRVYRGGSFANKGSVTDDLQAARTTYRHAKESTFTTTGKESSAIGFRCAVSADDPKLKEFIKQMKRR
jgi:formylglycine-generating enzyme required for sulfatase activity